MTANDQTSTTTSTASRAARTTSRIGLATKLLLGLLALAPASDAFALPSAPFADDIVGWSFDPNDPWQPPEPVDPGGGLPPLYATSPMIEGRTDRSITLSFHSSSDDAIGVALERSEGRDGKFENVRCWNTSVKGDSLDTVQQGGSVKRDSVKDGSVNGGSDRVGGAEKRDAAEKRGGASIGDNGCENGAFPASVVDAGLPRDALFCYRTRVWDAAGTSAVSPSRCAYTRGYAGEEAGDPAVTPWRAVLHVETGTASHAGTDDAVRVGLNDHWTNTTPHGNATWLDYRGDDLAAGDVFDYDLGLSSLEDLNDITLLSLFKDGTDDWCVSRVTLVVNDDELFDADLSGAPDGCTWVGDHEAITFDHDTLRGSPAWQDFASVSPGPVFEAEDTISRIESAVGNLAHYSELYWDEDDDGVWLSRVDDSTVHVEIETTAYVNNWSDPTVRLEFDVGIEIACTPDEDPGSDNLDVTIALVPRNARASAEGVLFELGELFYCGVSAEWNCIEEAINDGVMEGLPSFDGASINLPFCPSTTVDADGTVRFGL